MFNQIADRDFLPIDGGDDLPHRRGLAAEMREVATAQHNGGQRRQK